MLISHCAQFIILNSVTGMFAQEKAVYIGFGANLSFRHLQGVLGCIPMDKEGHCYLVFYLNNTPYPSTPRESGNPELWCVAFFLVT